MKLLIVTQKMDKSDPVLGFMHGWVFHFAKTFERISVVCLEKGKVELPKNVSVFSLGKEKTADSRRLGRGFTRMKYAWHFLRYITKFRNEYDAVFVHMNPEYMILGGMFWRFFRKSSALWYNHFSGGFMFRLAVFFSRKVFYTSPFSASARFGKSARMPAGIDTDFFSPRGEPSSRSALFVGRIAPVKGIHTLVESACILDREGAQFSLTIVGDALSRDAGYDANVRKEGAELVRRGKLVFKKGVPNTETPVIYSAHEVFVNLSPPGLFDKTVLEAFASGRVVVASSRAFAEILPEECLFEEGNAESLALTLRRVFDFSSDKKQKLASSFREYVVKRHSLSYLAEELYKNL